MTPAEVTAGYRGALLGQRAGMLRLSESLAASLYDPRRPLESITHLAALHGVHITRAQAAAIAAARDYLHRYTAASLGLPPLRVGPYPIPPNVLGMAASGRPISSAVQIAPGLYARYNGTALAGDPSVALNYLKRLAVSEPYRAANETVVHAAEVDDRLADRYDRITSAGACDFCRLIADRGYTEAAAGFAAHANCSCTAGPRIAGRLLAG